MIEENNDNSNYLLDLLTAEQNLARKQLLNNGLSFDVPVLSILGRLPHRYRDKNGRKARKLTIYKPYLHTMDVMSDLKLALAINLEQMRQNPINIYNKSVKANSKILANIVAVALLNRKWKIRWFGGWLTNYLHTRLDSEKLHGVCALILELEDAGNFINSTVLMSGAETRTTTPNTVEAKPAENLPGKPKE